MAKVPEICDYDCPHAAFPPAETAGICRTMSAVWCRELAELVNKNLPCEWRKRSGGAPPARAKAARGERRVKRVAGKPRRTKRAGS